VSFELLFPRVHTASCCSGSSPIVFWFRRHQVFSFLTLDSLAFTAEGPHVYYDAGDFCGGLCAKRAALMGLN